MTDLSQSPGEEATTVSAPTRSDDVVGPSLARMLLRLNDALRPLGYTVARERGERSDWMPLAITHPDSHDAVFVNVPMLPQSPLDTEAWLRTIAHVTRYQTERAIGSLARYYGTPRLSSPLTV